MEAGSPRTARIYWRLSYDPEREQHRSVCGEFKFFQRVKLNGFLYFEFKHRDPFLKAFAEIWRLPLTFKF